MTITEKIKAIREAKRLTQLEVADALELERANYARIENKTNGNNISYEFLEKIAKVLEVSISEIINYPDKPQIVPEIDNEKVEELENKVFLLEEKVILLKERIDLQEKLIAQQEKSIAQQEKIEKLRMAEVISMLTVISQFHPETVSTIENIGTDTEIGILVNNIKMALYKDDKFQKSVEKL